MEQKTLSSATVLVNTSTRSIIADSKHSVLDGTIYAPPKDVPAEWDEGISQLSEGSSSHDVQLMEPNELKPDRAFVDSDEDDDLLQESVVEQDERVRITPTGSPPYNWICSLRMTYSNGKRYIGTGFFCTVTGAKKLAVMTCAHNLWSNKRGGFASKVEIIRGRDGFQAPFGTFKASSYNLRVPEAYKRSPRSTNDYGLIVFDNPPPGDTAFGFGFGLLRDDELDGRIVQTCGYPGDKPGGSMWLAGGKIVHVKPNRIYYSNDTYGGQSGSPVWTWYGWNFMLVGIHGYGLKVRNGARRITNEMIDQIEQWMRGF